METALSFPDCSDSNNHTETIFITTLLDNLGILLTNSFIQPISINLGIATKLWPTSMVMMCPSPSSATWHLFHSAYLLSISLF